MIKSFWGDNHNGGMKLEIEEIGGVKIGVEELEEYFKRINIKSIKIRGNNINNVKWSNVKIRVKKNKK